MPESRTLLFGAAALLAVVGIGYAVAAAGADDVEEEVAKVADVVEDVDEADDGKRYKKEIEPEEEEPPAPVAPPAPAPPAAAAAEEAAPAPAESSPVDPAEAAAAAERAALKDEFSDVTRKGTKLMKAQAYDRAAVQFGRAIEIAETLDMPQASVETLYNNRAAMYEKAGTFDASLQDCTVVLAMNPGHIKVRKRRARIYEAQGRTAEALVEYCAVLVADTVDMRKRLEPFKEHPALFQQQQMKIMQEKGADAQANQEKLHEVMTLCGKAKAEGVEAERKRMGGLPATPGGAITSESSVFQLLLSYSEYLDAEPDAAAADLTGLNAAVVAANSSLEEGAAAAAAKVAALQARAMHFMATRAYAKASDDLMAAYAAFSATEAPPAGEAAVAASGLLRWVALFHHVRYDLEGALAVYEAAADCAKHSPEALARVEVMRSGVFVDKGSLPEAEAAIERAAALTPDSVDVLMHRSQLHLLAPDGVDRSEADLRACLAKRPDHVVALLRLAMMLISQAQQVAATGATSEAEAKLAEAEEAVAKAKASRPKMSEVFQVLGSIKEVRGEVGPAMEAHDKAIELDPKNPTPYINKGMLLSQTGQPSSQEEAVAQGAGIMALYAKAIEVDPLCSQAHKLQAEMKLRFATEFSETEGIVRDLDGAIAQCRDPAELVELCTFSCIAAAQLEAAKDLGMSSFADMNG